MIDFAEKELITKEELDTRLIDYMVEVQELDEDYIPFVMEVFEDPYSCCWIYQDYLGEQLVDGIHYEIRICRMDFSMFQTFDDEKHSSSICRFRQTMILITRLAHI